MSALRELTRSMPFELRDEGEDGDGLTLTGLAAVFGQPTEIDSWEGAFRETIRKGAFRKSLRERTPVMQFDHGHHPLIGSIPIGTITDLRETDEGLAVEGRISDNWLMQPVRDAIAEKSITGMSFRFSVVREEWRDNAGKLVRPEEVDALLWNPGDRGPLERTLVELKVPELGPVVFPAYDTTSVGVRARSLAETITDDGELRREVRRSLARDVIPGPKPGIEDLGDPDVRRNVARALLFGPETADTKTSDAPPAGHPSDTQERSQDAPAVEGHPSTTDAPPSDGHPSPEVTTTDQERLQAEMRQKAADMREHLASIADKEI